MKSRYLFAKPRGSLHLRKPRGARRGTRLDSNRLRQYSFHCSVPTLARCQHVKCQNHTARCLEYDERLKFDTQKAELTWSVCDSRLRLTAARLSRCTLQRPGYLAPWADAITVSDLSVTPYLAHTSKIARARPRCALAQAQRPIGASTGRGNRQLQLCGERQ